MQHDKNASRKFSLNICMNFDTALEWEVLRINALLAEIRMNVFNEIIKHVWWTRWKHSFWLQRTKHLFSTLLIQKWYQSSCKCWARIFSTRFCHAAFAFQTKLFRAIPKLLCLDLVCILLNAYSNSYFACNLACANSFGIVNHFYYFATFFKGETSLDFPNMKDSWRIFAPFQIFS